MKKQTLEHEICDLDQLIQIVQEIDADISLVKVLGKNANDKNQVYWSSDFDMLNQIFEFDYKERDYSTSSTKRMSDSSKKIPEGRFKRFSWFSNTGEYIPANEVKMLIYAQYPEMRLSAFKTIHNHIPESLSIEFTKKYPDIKRLLVLSRVPGKGAVAFMIVLSPVMLMEIKKLRGYKGSSVIKLLHFSEEKVSDLKDKLSKIVGNWMPGVRLHKDGVTTLPFNGTQVCGYTLEHALGIPPNSDKHGDYENIELKTHTMKKVTLMTPEPDMGLYYHSFIDFMTDEDICYKDDKGNWRFTGVHKANILCKKSNLILKIIGFDPEKDKLSESMGNDIYVGLFKPDGTLAAGWSMERLMNCWGAKHNESVYVPASKKAAELEHSLTQGSKFDVTFDNKVMWCKGTGPEKILQAISKGIVILDPAPKYVPNNPGQSKRRSQWRVNNIFNAVEHLYDEINYIDL